METQARIGYGTVLEIALKSAPTVFTYIKEVFEATPPAETDDNAEASHFQSPGRFREYIPNLSDGGEASFGLNLVPGSAVDVFLGSLRGLPLLARVTFPNGVQVIFSCLRQSYEKEVPLDDRMTATLTLKVSGQPYLTGATAPRNLVEPAISGTPKVGQPLTVNPGDWAGAASITYQWQVDTSGNGTFANISGATGQTYVPVANDQGDDIRCVVNGANDDFSTAANSPETASVAAA